MSRRLRVAFGSVGSYSLAGDAGAFVLTGQAAGLNYGAPSEPAGVPAPLSVTASVTGAAVPFTAGYAVRQGDIPSGSGVAITGATAQATVKNTWPDGSVKFCVIAGTVNATADVPVEITVAAGTASSGTALSTTDLQAALTQPVTIDAGAFGSASWSGSDWASPFEAWVAGHRMSSWVYRKPIGTDDHLVAWLEVRLYAGGAVEILPWVENGYLLVAGPTSKSATYTFTMGGTARFSAAIDIPHHCRTVLLSGTATAHWLGTDPDVIVKHDAGYMQSSALVPCYLADTPADAAVVTALPTTFAPFQQGSWPAGMGSGGYHGSIGLLPEWDVLYLTCQAPSIYKSVLFNAYSAGRYAVHYRDEADGNRWARLSQHTTLNIRAPEAGWETTPAATGTSSPSFSLSHQPSVGYMAYLVTGRRYFLDQLQAVATSNALNRDSTTREAGLGLYKSTASSNTRHVAWCLRTLAQAITATPDADSTVQGEFRAQYQNNVNYYHTKYVTVANSANPVRFVEDSDYNGGAGDSMHFGATWQQDFLTASLGYAMDLGLQLDGTHTTKLSEFFEWHAPSIIGRLGTTAADQFLYRDYDVYTIATAPADAPDYETGTGPWYADWGEVYDATYGGTNGEDTHSYGPYVSRGSRVEGGTRRWYYEDSAPISALPAIAYCVKHGVTGAWAAYLRLTSAQNWSEVIVPDLDNHPLWGVTWYAQPLWQRGQAVNEWREISGTSVSFTPTNTARLTTGATSSGATHLDAFCGMGVDLFRGAAWQIANGGHGDYYGNEIVKLDLLADEPAWVEWFNGSSGDVVVVGGSSDGYYLDDGVNGSLPPSAHTYGLTWPIHRHNRMLRLGDVSVSPTGSAYVDTESYDITAAQGTNGWGVQYEYKAHRVSTYTGLYTGATFGIASTACLDPRFDKIYHMGPGGVFVHTPSEDGPDGTNYSGGTWASMGTNPGFSSNAPAAAVDTKRGRILTVYGGTADYNYYDIDTATFGVGTFGGTGAATIAAAAQPNSVGLTYVPSIDSFLVRHGASGGDVLQIDASGTVTALQAEPLTTTGGSTIPETSQYASGGATPYHGVYNRFQYIPVLRGVVFAVRNNSNVWFLRTE